ncbi:hypothetical protein GGR51DRAFT_553658 [Nemania sp. FL0031]|nr:hypothetical protein GGR51DRAFT_553658 [Nemania sp. FL0031]
MALEEPKPRVVIVALNQQPWFDQIYTPFLSQLASKATILQVKKASFTVRLLEEEPHPSAALITDEALTVHKNAHVWEAVLQYVRHGGTAVVMGCFSSFVLPSNIQLFFAKAGLQWRSGSYHRTTRKALLLKNVAASDAWYRSTDKSVIESPVFAPTSAHNDNETAVAMVQIGDGKLGYVGGVNAEIGSNAAVLAMCGLSK